MPSSASITNFVNQGFALPFLLKEPECGTVSAKAIILLHGVGSNENSLFGLERQFAAGIAVIAPRAPYAMGDNRYSWYKVDFSGEEPVINEAQEVYSRRLLVEFIEQLKKVYRFGEIYLGGFSQGAIMSYGAALTHPGLVNGILIMSGRILPHAALSAQLSSQNRLKAFIAHGVEDRIVRIQWAREARNSLEAAGLQPAYHEYTAGHQVTDDMVKDLAAWVSINIDAV